MEDGRDGRGTEGSGGWQWSRRWMTEDSGRAEDEEDNKGVEDVRDAVSDGDGGKAFDNSSYL